MELSEKMRESLFEEAGKYFDGEIPDKIFESIGGGRQLSVNEFLYLERAREFYFDKGVMLLLLKLICKVSLWH